MVSFWKISTDRANIVVLSLPTRYEKLQRAIKNLAKTDYQKFSYLILIDFFTLIYLLKTLPKIVDTYSAKKISE